MNETRTEEIQEKILHLEKQISDERARLSTDRMDISFGEIINLYKNEELIIQPEYQRMFRWSTKQKTALIESILLAIPIPPIFVSEDKDGIWELVDGLQRVSTIVSFFGALQKNVSTMVEDEDEDEYDNFKEDEEPRGLYNKWKLEEGGLIKELEGFDIDTLPSKYKVNIKRAVCRVEILRGESNIAMKYELFKRLNAGGSPLSPQEVRNAIYRGINPRINTLILDLSRNTKFKELTELSNSKKQVLYDQELILKFLAFYNRIEDINYNTEIFLDKFMENAVKDETFDIEVYRKIFNEVIDMIYAIGNTAIFKNNRNAFVPAYYEGIVVGVAQNIELYRNNKDLLETRIQELKIDDQFKDFSGSASNSKTRVRKRLNRSNEIFSQQ